MKKCEACGMEETQYGCYCCLHVRAKAVFDAILEVHSGRGDIDRIFIAAGLSVPAREVGDKATMP